MTGPGGVPARHPVAVNFPVVVLQLMQTAEGNEAILAGLFCAQKVILPAAPDRTGHVGSSYVVLGEGRCVWNSWLVMPYLVVVKVRSRQVGLISGQAQLHSDCIVKATICAEAAGLSTI